MPATEPIEGRCGSPLPGKRGYCAQPAGQRTDHQGLGHCWLHGGRQETFESPRVVADMRTRVAKFGIPRDAVDPGALLLEQIAVCAGHVDYLASQLDGLNDDDLVKGVRSVTRETGTGLTPSGSVLPIDRTTTVVGPAEHMLWKLYGQERDRLFRMTREAIALGLAERQVRLAEEQGQLAARLVVAVLGDLDLTEEQRAGVPGLVRRHLHLVRPA